VPYSFYGNDALYGNNGDDTITGSRGSCALYGGDGNDTLIGGNLYYLDNGHSYLYGGNGNDTLYAGGNGDVLDGGNGNDILHGSAGGDTLNGGNGNDILDGGGFSNTGQDVLTGGAGKDTFILHDLFQQLTIADFNPIDDTINLHNLGLALCVLNADNFVIGSQAIDGNDYIIYDKIDGILFIDLDGSGTGIPEILAAVGVNLPITHADFVVV
jgi:Ca2+-binding RTX toxin-like protein